MPNTPISDSGAMPGPTVTTVPVRPWTASPSRFGVGAASTGCDRRARGSDRPPTRPSTRTAARCSYLDDEREVFWIEARAADEGAVDLGVRQEAEDVPGL